MILRRESVAINAVSLSYQSRLEIITSFQRELDKRDLAEAGIELEHKWEPKVRKSREHCRDDLDQATGN